MDSLVERCKGKLGARQVELLCMDVLPRAQRGHGFFTSSNHSGARPCGPSSLIWHARLTRHRDRLGSDSPTRGTALRAEDIIPHARRHT